MSEIFAVITESERGRRSVYLIAKTEDIQTQEDAANRVLLDPYRDGVVEVSGPITNPSMYPTPNQLLYRVRTTSLGRKAEIVHRRSGLQ